MFGALKILLGVSGGIAAYKACTLIRLLRKEGHTVRVVMTEAAQHFVGPLSFQALSGNPVHTDLMDLEAESAMGHIELARWADLVLIAPTTADLLAKIAYGFAGDLLTSLCLATKAPLVLAPAMNVLMFNKSVTQENIAKLQLHGISILGPSFGEQACGDLGLGCMLEPELIIQELKNLGLLEVQEQLLAGLRVLVSAGPTQEALDPIRYLTNHSSGKMGFAMAEAAKAFGAEVVLVTGPVALTMPQGMQVHSVVSAEEMHTAILEQAENCDLFIATAAVADYRPKKVAVKKLKKGEELGATLSLELVQTPDILKAVASLVRKPFCVGFAAETHQGSSYAKKKLIQKGLDMIALNEIGQPNVGFHSDANALTVFWREGQESIPLASKKMVAAKLIKIISREFYAKSKS